MAAINRHNKAHSLDEDQWIARMARSYGNFRRWRKDRGQNPRSP